MRIKAREQHLIDDKNINSRLVLETLGNGFAFLCLALVVEDEFGNQRMRELLLELIKEFLHLACLLVVLQDNHTCHGRIVVLLAEATQVLIHILDEGVEVVVGLDDEALAEVLVGYFRVGAEFVLNDLQKFILVVRLDLLAHKAKGEAVGDGFVVVVFVIVIAKDLPCLALLAQERRTRERNTHGLSVGTHQISQERALWVIATVCLVHEEDALDIRAIGHLEFVGLLLKFLDINYRYLRFAIGATHGAVALEVVHEFLATIGREDCQPAAGELAHGLLHQADSVHDEIETCYYITFGKIVGKYLDSEIGESGLATTLGVPYRTRVDLLIQITADSLAGKELRIAHHMFLKCSHALAILVIDGTLYIRKAILEEIEDTLFC